MQLKETTVNGLHCIALNNEQITVLVCPALGGKIVSIKLNDQQQELLWHNPGLQLQVLDKDAVYDDNFFGGVDELLPNDEKEVIGQTAYPDHGELWTSALTYSITDNSLNLKGDLSQTGFGYERNIRLEGQKIISDYKITNLNNQPNPFLWKMHAAMQLHEGDRLICPAKTGEIGDEDFTGRQNLLFFDWPNWQEDRLDEVPSIEAQTNEFFFLSEMEQGFFRHESASANTFFEYQFDKEVFPYAWYFASYGGWNGLYTGVLEPATAIPHTLSKSIENHTCPTLAAGEHLSTQVIISVGRLS